VITGHAAVRQHHIRGPATEFIDVLIPVSRKRRDAAFARVHRTTHLPTRAWRLGPLLAQALLGTVQAQGDMFRQYQGFAAVVPVPDDASTFDRALALSGRDLQWKPGN
jgi:hypothetical protein